MSDIKNNSQQIIQNNDMFEGPIIPLLIKLSFPIFIGMAFSLVYNIINTIWLSLIDKNDPSYIGGIGLVLPIFFLVIAISSGLAIGISSLVARSIGDKNYKVLNKTVESSLAISISLSIIFFIILFVWGKDLLILLDAKGDFLIHADNYLKYVLPALIMLMIFSVFNGILQGEGKMKYLMFAIFIGTICNFILDPIFIFFLNLKVVGAAIATDISQLVALIFVIIIFIKKKSIVKMKFKISNISLKIIKQILFIGIFQTSGQILLALNFAIINKIIMSVDPLALTAYALCGRFDQAVYLPILAISSALITIIGQNASRGNLERVHQIWRKSILLSVVVISALATIMIIAAPFIYPLFSNVKEVFEYSILQTRIIEFAFVFSSIGILGRSTFQATGYPLQGFLLEFLRLIVFSIPIAIVLVYVFDLKIFGAWSSFITGNVITAFIGFFWLENFIRKIKAGKIPIIKIDT